MSRYQKSKANLDFNGARDSERQWYQPVSYTHLRAHETRHDLVCRLLLEKSAVKHETLEASFLSCLHTHTFNGPFSGTTQVSRYQKGKTNLDFTEARDSLLAL